jgi:undecaprenyl diphosphate synthase
MKKSPLSVISYQLSVILFLFFLSASLFFSTGGAKMHKNFVKIIKPNSEEAELLGKIDFDRLPNHIAIIMDGNGRWAKARGKPRIFGHRAGAESVRAILDTCARLQIKAVTLYAFSTENWKRPETEVSGLMEMLKYYLKKELKTVHKNNIRFQAIGKIQGLAEDIQNQISYAEAKTAENTGTVLSVALNYGGRAEITEAAKRAAEKVLENGKSLDDLSESDIEENLYTRGLPEVDLLIRTSGEFRISNFLLWQLAYSEIYVTPTLFPDFRRAEIFKAILDFQKRERRFGGVESK